MFRGAGAYFDRVVNQILQKDFTIQKMPMAKICQDCELKSLCHGDGVISREAAG
jgi:radical SAM protein with 4Fe4S-binding SPASM domain